MAKKPESKERPILFNAAMVRAILDRRKTQTRRVIKDDWWRCLDPADADDLASAPSQCPYGKPGDRLWVRESFYPTTTRDFKRGPVIYKADTLEAKIDGEPLKWKPSIHMPRWASRITLEIENVRVERLQEITHEDAVAEGCFERPGKTWGRLGFSQLWDTINAKRGYSWESNPWVWVLQFKRL